MIYPGTNTLNTSNLKLGRELILCGNLNIYILNRLCLETLYISIVRPILECGDILIDNCTQQEKYELDKIQHEATKLVSIENLYKETGLETLEDR